MTAGTGVVEFSPTERLQQTMAVVGANNVRRGCPVTGVDDRRDLADKLVTFLETGTPPQGLFTPEVFCDFTMPQWRVQAQGGYGRSACVKPNTV